MNLPQRYTAGRALALTSPPLAAGHTADGHPAWCARAHHCTAHLGRRGEHASVPEVWATAVGRLVATRYQRHDGTRDRLELRAVIELTGDEKSTQESTRLALAATYAALVHTSRTGSIR